VNTKKLVKWGLIAAGVIAAIKFGPTLLSKLGASTNGVTNTAQTSKVERSTMYYASLSPLLAASLYSAQVDWLCRIGACEKLVVNGSGGLW